MSSDTTTDTDALKINFIDCNTWIGRRSGGHSIPATPVSASDLEAEMNRFGIDRAVTYHALAREYHPTVGNAQIVADVAHHARLLPAWVLLPSHTEEMPAPKDLDRHMDSQNIRYAVMFPSSSLAGHRYSLASWCVGDLLRVLEQRRLPLALDFTLFRRDEPPWDAIFDICSDHPALPIILTDVQGRNNRTLYALLRRFDNIYIQTAGFDVHCGIEDVTQRFGPERLIYGSGYPIKTMGGAQLQVRRANLTVHEKYLIAGANLERLMNSIAR